MPAGDLTDHLLDAAALLEAAGRCDRAAMDSILDNCQPRAVAATLAVLAANLLIRTCEDPAAAVAGLREQALRPDP